MSLSHPLCFLLSALLLFVLGPALAWADCTPRDTEVYLSTALSARINRVGHPVRAVVIRPVESREGEWLLSGSVLSGRVMGVKPWSRTHQPGELWMVFDEGRTPAGERLAISAMPATPDGWLSPGDMDTEVWHAAYNRSTRLLNAMVRARLGSDQAVWAQTLGLNTSRIPDVSTDRFIEQYSRHDVLLGAGDRLTLRFAPCKMAP